MLVKRKNGLYCCPEHNCYAEWCQNSYTGAYFVKCPKSEKFECGTKTISKDELNSYDKFAPYVEASILSQVRDAIEKDDEREKW